MSRMCWGCLAALIGVAGCQNAEPPAPPAKATPAASRPVAAHAPLANGAAVPQAPAAADRQTAAVGELPKSVPLPQIFAQRAAATRSEPADPTGTWKWSTTFNDQSFEQTLVLKLEGDRLVGTLTRGGGKGNPITDASFKDGNVVFTVVRERMGEKTTSKYEGKINGDAIRGHIEIDSPGQARKRDWEASRTAP